MHTHTHLSAIGGVRRFPYQPFGLMPKWYDGVADGGAGGQGGGAGAGVAGAGGQGAGAGGDGGNGQPKIIQISEEEFEQRIVGRIKQAESTWKKSNTVSTLTAEERVELEAARKEREENKRKELESKGQYDAALKAQEESLRKPYEEKEKKFGETIGELTSRLRTEIVTNKLLAAAAAGNAYDANEVVELTQKYVKLDDQFQSTVVDKDGNPRFVAGKPMTPEQLIEEFLRSHPNHVKAPAGTNGGGAAGGAHRSGAGDLSEMQRLEAEVEELAKQYRATRSADVQSLFRKKSAELKKLKTAA